MQTEPQDTPFEAPGRGGFVPEKLLGRTGDDFESTTYTTMGLEEICLENIVMAHLNQDILKKNFEIIINALRLQTQKIAGLSRHFTNYDDMINEIKESVFHNDKKLEDLKEKGFSSSKDLESQAERESFIEEIRKLKVCIPIVRLRSFDSLKIFIGFRSVFFIQLYFSSSLPNM